MNRTIRLCLLVTGASFALAALVHAGVLPLGYEHEGAYVPESVISTVLLAGFALTWLWPAGTRLIGLATQAFALLGSLVGLYVGVIGVGPHTIPDFIFHVGIVLALLCGLVVATRGDGAQGGARLAAVTVVQVLIRATGLLQLALGLAFWTGYLRVALPFHLFSGLLFVVLLLAQTGLAAWAGAPWPLVLVAFAWALVVPVFGLAHAALLPGHLHWIVQAAHLVVGLLAIGLAERLSAAARARLESTGAQRPARVAPQPAQGAPA
jgi:hypothetical protein